MAGFRADLIFSGTLSMQYNGGGSNYVVQTPTGVLYMVYADGASDLQFRKSTDGGMSWGAPVLVFAGTLHQLSVWYDRWSGIAAGLIHIAYSETVTDDIRYRTINTESSDALSTETTLLAGTSTATGGQLTITRAVGGNVYVRGCIDAGAEGGFYRLANADVPNGAWTSRTLNEALATTDQMILMPWYAADTQDIIGIFLDASANELTTQLYDDSANTWSEDIIESVVEQAVSTAWPHFAAAPDPDNTRIVLVLWNAIDTVNADLMAYTLTHNAGVVDIAATTIPISNSTDDQGLAALSIDTQTGHWWAFYGGKTDGSETYNTAINIYCKVSTDEGTTWGPETQITNRPMQIPWLVSCPRFAGNPPCAYQTVTSGAINDLLINVALPRRHAAHQMYGG